MKKCLIFMTFFGVLHNPFLGVAYAVPNIDTALKDYSDAVTHCVEYWKARPDGTNRKLMECQNNALDTYTGPFDSNPDITEKYKKKRLQIAQDLDDNKISKETAIKLTKKAGDDAQKKVAARQKTAAVEEANETPVIQKCKSYGFKKGTTAFANCAMKLEQAQVQQQQEQAQRQQQLDQQKAALEAQILAERQAQSDAAYNRQMQFFSRLSQSKNPSLVGALGEAAR